MLVSTNSLVIFGFLHSLVSYLHWNQNFYVFVFAIQQLMKILASANISNTQNLTFELG